MKIEIQSIDWEKTIPIRHSVLWPDKPPEFCFINGDEGAWHFAAYLGENIVSVASVYPTQNQARLRKFATLEEYQNQGIGSEMLTHILSDLKAKNITNFWCDARASAIDFYKRFGLEIEGPKFYKSEIAYYKMVMEL